MNKLFIVVAAAAGLVVAGSFPAAGQSPDDLPEILVTAPRILTKPVKGPHPTAGQEEISISLKVGYSDLDLKKPDDVQVLQGRVKDAAKSICADLDEVVPATARLNRDCVEATVAKAKPRIDLAIAKAQ